MYKRVFYGITKEGSAKPIEDSILPSLQMNPEAVCQINPAANQHSLLLLLLLLMRHQGL